MTVIAFFGASVTAQKNGYVHVFKQLSPDDTIIQEGHGAMHINNAGICLIDTIIQEKPSICFIEWFSTGFVSSNVSLYLDCIVNKLYSINCNVVFLLVDRIDMSPERYAMYASVKEYAVIYGIDVISLYDNTNKTELLRDTVHTTNAGSKYYASAIYNYYQKYTPSPISKIPPTNAYSFIKSVSVNRIINKSITLRGDFEIIGIYQELGVYSGLLDIKTNEGTSRFNNWDQWCYYTRKCIKCTVKLCKECTITILHDEFDTSQCKDNTVDFSSIPKYMNIHTIFYRGDSLSIYEIDETPYSGGGDGP